MYSVHIEPLTRAFSWLEASATAVHLRVTQARQRQFQVIAGCSHPIMTVPGDAGYILFALKKA